MFYLGIDVSKAKLDGCILLADKRKTKAVQNNAQGITELLAWLQRLDLAATDTHAILEGTGVYHESAAFLLHDAGLRVSIVNPAQARDFGKGLGIRTKTDKVDSQILARYGALLQPPAWQPPSPQARTLQALLSRREALMQDLQRERNRQEKASLTHTPEQIHQSLRASIDFITQQLRALEKERDDHIDRHPELKQDLALLQSIPAVGPQVGSHLLSVLHAHPFQSAEQLAAYLGLVPVERQSGTSLHARARLSKTGPARLRAILYMAAIVAARHNPHVKALYERLLAKGKSKMAALGAAMRKIVHLCFGVVKHQRPYQHDYVANP